MIIKEYDFFHIFDFNEATTGIVKPKKYKTKENEMINLVSGDTDNNGISFFRLGIHDNFAVENQETIEKWRLWN